MKFNCNFIPEYPTHYFQFFNSTVKTRMSIKKKDFIHLANALCTPQSRQPVIMLKFGLVGCDDMNFHRLSQTFLMNLWHFRGTYCPQLQGKTISIQDHKFHIHHHKNTSLTCTNAISNSKDTRVIKYYNMLGHKPT